jgi:N,N'-diacetyllegionaminate synthase
VDHARATNFSIAGHRIGVGFPALIVGEVGLTHDGSLGIAHAFIDAIAAAGADAAKFQTHIAEAESTPAERFRVPFSRQDASRFDYWRRTAFREEDWRELAEHAREQGLIFLSSPFSLEAVDLLERVGIPAWKVASGEVSNHELLDRMADSGLPVLLSSGLSSLAELDGAVAILQGRGTPFAVLQATSAYPCPPERVGLNMLEVLRTRYGCPVGLSDHSGTIYPSLAAIVLGASLVEVHVTLSRQLFGPDVPASVTTEELSRLCEGVCFIETMLANPVDKNALSEEFAPLRELFTKSIVARFDLTEGTTLARKHLALKKPGLGLPPSRLEEILGRRLLRPLRADEALQEGDLE